MKASDYLSKGWIPIADDDVVLATDRLLWMESIPTSLVVGSPFIGKTPSQISKEEGFDMTFLRYDEDRDRKITG